MEGTLVSVARDGCTITASGPFPNLMQLLEAWAAKANTELAKTPDQLVREISSPPRPDLSDR